MSITAPCLVWISQSSHCTIPIKGTNPYALFFSGQNKFLQTEKRPAPYQKMVSLQNHQTDNFGFKSIERNAINEFIFEFGDGFSNADNSANVIGNNHCETLEYNSSLDKPL
jgi:hypothetical protein